MVQLTRPVERGTQPKPQLLLYSSSVCQFRSGCRQLPLREPSPILRGHDPNQPASQSAVVVVGAVVVVVLQACHHHDHRQVKIMKPFLAMHALSSTRSLHHYVAPCNNDGGFCKYPTVRTLHGTCPFLAWGRLSCSPCCRSPGDKT